MEITKEKNTTLLDKINNYILSMQKVWIKEKVVFYRLLATMTNAWMSLLKSVSVLEKQEKNLVFKNILTIFEDKLRSWNTFSDCLENYPDSFSEAEVWIVKSWEKTWKLNVVLNDLANQIEKVDSINWKLKWALMYPAFILIVVFWVVFVMMTMVVPKLLDIFEDKSSLPATTKTLIAVSDFFVWYWFLIIIFFVAVFVWIWIWKKTQDWKYLFDKFILFYVPIFWQVTKKIVLSKFSRIFSWLISSWISVVESLNITSRAVWNEVYRQKILLLSQDVKSGIKIAESIEWDSLFPDMMVQMIQVWEETAKLDQTIVKVADFYDEQVDNTINTLNKLLEPFIIVFLAVVVGFIAMAIMQPIMNLADTVSNS